jgi:ribosomal protein S18 acetylase RimI-like enzyme
MTADLDRALTIRRFREADTAAVIDLWRACELVVPWNDPAKDVRRKLAVQPEMFLVGEIGDRVVASVMAGYEGHRGWINYLAVAPDLRRQGLGRRMMDAAEAHLRAAGCPKINLQVRTSNTGVIAFYERIGYTLDDVVSLGKRLEED